MTIQNGEIFSLIGHNGARKTTAISILTSIIDASRGEIYVDGLPLSENRDAIKKRIGYVPDSPDIFWIWRRGNIGTFWQRYMGLSCLLRMSG